MSQITGDTPVYRIEIVDQPDEIEQQEKRALRFSLPLILALSLLGLFFLFRRNLQQTGQ